MASLYTQCSSCNAIIKVKSSASTRPDLQFQKSDKLEIICTHCGQHGHKHVNDIKAQANKIMILSGLGIGAITTIALWFYYGAIGTISLTIPMYIWQDQKRSVNLFNSYFVKRK